MARPLASFQPSGGLPVLGLLVDWGGVLTAPLEEALGRWLTADGIHPDHLADVLRAWLGLGEDRVPDAAVPKRPGRDHTRYSSPVHELERGELPEVEFEQLLATALTERGSPVAAEGLLDRVLAGLAELDEGMVDLVTRVRRSGVPVALVSNSWGERYPARLFDGFFDAVVISGRVGMRKPEPGIFRYAATALDIPLNRCVLVDDLESNVAGARLVGAGAVHHTGVAATVSALEELLDLRPRHLPGPKVGSPAPPPLVSPDPRGASSAPPPTSSAPPPASSAPPTEPSESLRGLRAGPLTGPAPSPTRRTAPPVAEGPANAPDSSSTGK